MGCCNCCDDDHRQMQNYIRANLGRNVLVRVDGSENGGGLESEPSSDEGGEEEEDIPERWPESGSSGGDYDSAILTPTVPDSPE